MVLSIGRSLGLGQSRDQFQLIGGTDLAAMIILTMVLAIAVAIIVIDRLTFGARPRDLLRDDPAAA